ncbi:MAG TPA: FtsX-like permease family protein [Symbiobacteriaceae bacterium]|nr:FtsX-like permease family protein [Symbiobacteriaceae bacterium]
MKSLKFAWRQALREMRRGRSRFLFFLLAIAIGVAGLVGIKGFNAAVQSALLREARTLMAADMKVQMNRPPGEQGLAHLDELKTQGIAVLHVTETTSMAINPTSKDSTLVELKAIEPGYPFYGELITDPPGALSTMAPTVPAPGTARAAGATTGQIPAGTALVGADLLDRLGLTVGDQLKLGTQLFKIGGIITQEPDRVAANFGLGPRVMISQADLATTGLMGLGARANHSFLLKLPDQTKVEAIRTGLTEAFKPEKGRVSDFREAQPQIKRFLDRMTAFLSLVSMISLLVGGLGVANVTRVFIQQKLDSIAIMKCVGATNQRVTLVYLIQVLLLAVAGSALGILFGWGIQLVLPAVIGPLLDVELTVGLSPVVALQGLLVGLLTAVLFTLIPLAGIRDVKPALVFRREMADQKGRLSAGTWGREVALLAVAGLGLALIASWLAGRFDWGFWFMGGLAGAILLLWGAAALAVRIVRRIKLPRRFVSMRQGLANVHRPGSQAAAIVLALGIGVTIVLGVTLLQRGLLQEVTLTSPAGTPNLFVMGLSEAESKQFTTSLRAQPGVESLPDPSPIARGKLLAIDGKKKEELTLSDEGERWFNFTFNATWAATQPPSSEIVQGAWWTGSIPAGEKWVSVEQEAAQVLNLQIGSLVQMEMEGGAPVTAKVVNIRKTTDFRAGGGFNFVFAPGALDGVPATYLAQARVQSAASRDVQRLIASQFPTAMMINLNDILTTVSSVLDRIAMVIRFVAGFSILAGLVILSSSIVSTKYRRTRDAVLYKTLGASRKRVWQIFAMEYATLGLVAGLVGAIISVTAAWVVLKQVMEVSYHFEALPVLIGIIGTVVLTVLVGILSTLDVLAAKPLQVLREE